MMELSADPFSASQISQSCWSVCHDLDTITAQLLPTSMPIYRDEATRKQFEDVVNFFGCMDICEKRYIVKRVAVLVPVATVGKYISKSLKTSVQCWTFLAQKLKVRNNSASIKNATYFWYEKYFEV